MNNKVSSLTKTWEEVISTLPSKIGSPNTKRWIVPLEMRDGGKDKHKKSVLQLWSPNKFFSDWVIDNYQDYICEALEQICQKNDLQIPAVKFLFKRKRTNKASLSQLEEAPIKKKKPVWLINSKSNFNYTFSRFIEGDSNKFAVEIAKEIANTGGQSNVGNPVTFYGNVGVGKTHIINAIYNQLKNKQEDKIIFTTLLEFKNSLYKSFELRETNEFLNHHNEADFIFIDDVHFISKYKESNFQEHFFNFINNFLTPNKTVMFTCENYPSSIENITRRFHDRMMGGAIAEIEPPEFDVRVGILRQESKEKGLKLPLSMMELIAEKLPKNARQLRGAISDVLLHSQLLKKGSGDINEAFILKALDGRLQHVTKTVTVTQVVAAVSDYYKVSVSDLLSASRRRALALPRQVAMYLIKTKTSVSFPEIAKQFLRHHSTVIHAINSVEESMKVNSERKRQVRELEQILNI